MPVKLLRAIQEKSIRPVGAAAEIQVDVRILSATHKDLSQLVNDSRFRHDLYYRVNVIGLNVPALRERTGDLPLLSGTILRRLAQAMQRPAPALADDAVAALEAYHFPGNVRELENILERALAMADDDRITAADLHLPVPRGAQSSSPPQPASPFVTGTHQALPPGPSAPRDPRTGSPYETAGTALPSFIEDIERATIQQALQENRH